MEKHIKYGKFERTDWNLVSTLKDPLVKEWLDCVEFIDWEGYELWAHGGILEDRMTVDLDLTIVGPDEPDRVNFMLETLVACGFHLGLFIDIKYLYDGQLFDHQEWLDDGKYIYNVYASLAPEITINGSLFVYGKLLDGYYLADQIHPLGKVRGKDMPSPLRIK
jgi:hypothetical protein